MILYDILYYFYLTILNIVKMSIMMTGFVNVQCLNMMGA